MVDEDASDTATVEVEIPVDTGADDGAPTIETGDTTVIVETPAVEAVSDVSGAGIHPAVAEFMAETRVQFEQLNARLGETTDVALSASAAAADTAAFIDEVVASVDETADEVMAAVADVQPATPSSDDVPPLNARPPVWFRKRARKSGNTL